MLMWPANSWLFWVLIAVAFAAAMRFGLFPTQGANVSRRRIVALLVFAAGAVVAVIVLPMLVFATATGNSMNNPIDLAMWTGAIFLGVLALLVATWALFADSSRGRKRCPRCWYDMSASPTLTCPECGTTAKSVSALFRTRRQWRGVAVAMLLVLLGAAVAIGPHIRAGKAYELLPDVVIMVLAPYATGGGDLSKHVNSRFWYDPDSVGIHSDGWLRNRVRHWMVPVALNRKGNTVAVQRGLQMAQFDKAGINDHFPRLLELTADPSPVIAGGALGALAASARDRAESRAAAMRAIESGNPQLISYGLAMFWPEGTIGQPVPLTQELIDFSRHANPQVRYAVIRMAWSFEDDEDRREMIRRSLTDESPRVRGNALMAMAYRPPWTEDFERALDAGLRDPDTVAARSAVWALIYSELPNLELWALVPSALTRVAKGDAEYIVPDILRHGCAPAKLQAVLEIAKDPNLRLAASGALMLCTEVSDEHLAQMRELEQAWRDAGDTAAADAMVTAVRTFEERRAANAEAQPSAP